MAKVLIIEDSRVQAMMLARELEKSSKVHEVILAYNGRDGVEVAQRRRPDLILLDLCLPVRDGLDALRDLRAGEKTRDVLVIITTAKGAVADQLVGFALGADDYVVKPYEPKVLVARIESMLRRHRPPAWHDEAVVEREGVVVDRVRHRAIWNGRELTLTPTEFRLLDVLVRRPGRTFTRSELIDALVGVDSAILEGTINAYVRNLRQKLGEGGEMIETVRGVGYRLRVAAYRPGV